MLYNLNDLVKPIKDSIDLFEELDCELPEDFKQALTKIGNDTIRYGRYSSVITNSFGQHIFLSNNWFYIAAALSSLYTPFETYKNMLNQMVSKDILKSKDKNAIIAAIKSSQKLNLKDEEKDLVIKFATDYSWWTGGRSTDGKSLDRADCLVSGILSIANVVNNSQAYIATLWNYLGTHVEIANLLIKQFSKYIANNNSFKQRNPTTFKNIPQIPFAINPIIEAIKSTNLIYSDDLIKRFAYSLMTKPFVILSGLAGSGKTQLALAFAKCLCENIYEQIKVVPVGADWTNREPLLGYPNALNHGEYVKTEKCVIDLLINANNNPSKPYFLVLDEMNMSVVERYFADFLSVMESGEEIPLWDGSEDDPTPTSIALPKNVYIIGTINVDETTYMFSPKVLDRANVIEFKIASDEMESFLNNQKPLSKDAANSVCANMANDFVNRTKENTSLNLDEPTKTKLLDFFNQLKSVNSEFGYRTLTEMFRYIALSKQELKTDKALDTAILQKMLPKLHGSKKKLKNTINALWKLCYSANPQDINDSSDINSSDIIYKESADKILRMYRAMEDNGFTSFAEA